MLPAILTKEKQWRNKKVLLPVRDKDLFRRALLDAQFLGIEWLLEAVKDCEELLRRRRQLHADWRRARAAGSRT